jgi:hypothetical protein
VQQAHLETLGCSWHLNRTTCFLVKLNRGYNNGNFNIPVTANR